MSENKANEGNESNIVTLYEEIDGQIIVTLDSGARVRCMPVGDLFAQVGQGIKDPPKPKPPTYTVVDIAGDVTEHDHTQATIDDERTEEETRQEWAAYQADLADWKKACAENNAKRTEMRGRFLIRKGFQVMDLPNLVKWAEEQRELYGFDIPSDPLGLYDAYIQHEVVRTRHDGELIALGMYKASGMSEEVLGSIESTFRR